MKQAALIIALFALLFSGIGILIANQTSGRMKTLRREVRTELIDSVSVAEIVDQKINESKNPTFVSPSEVYAYVQSKQAEQDLLQEFLSLPIDKLINVAEVCIKARGSATMVDIVNSYNEHKEVYDNMPTVPIEPEIVSPPDSSKTQELQAMKIIVGNETINVQPQKPTEQ